MTSSVQNRTAERAAEKIPPRDRAPFGSCPVESIDIHHDFAAEQPADGGVMAHANVYKEHDIVAANRQCVNDREERRDETRKVLSPGEGT